MLSEKKFNFHGLRGCSVFIKNDEGDNNTFLNLSSIFIKTNQYKNQMIFNDTFLSANMTINQSLKFILNPLCISNNIFYHECNFVNDLDRYKNQKLHKIPNSLKLEFKILLFLYIHAKKNFKICIIEKDIAIFQNIISQDRVIIFDELLRSNNIICFPPSNQINKNHDKFFSNYIIYGKDKYQVFYNYDEFSLNL